MGRLENKVAIITGAASGMGEAAAKLFAQEGAKVILTDIQEERLQEVVKEITSNGYEALGLVHDVSSEEAWGKVVAEGVKAFGKIDVLVNNAGIAQSGQPFEDITLEYWNKFMAVNLSSVFLSAKYVLPVMKENGGGSIINVSSIAGLTGGSGAGPYTASKGAVRLFTKSIAIDYAKDNIRSNSIHPGYIETPMSKAFFENENYLKYFKAKTPLPYLGKAEDIANGMLFLASDESSFITGAELVIDGGYSAQ
ncbi:SDR family NAD(P)-dependent oxidoreductase [Phosphitispora sp. TUW77]|uniref:SDR family NAD(P)-dependent oxidoreductase n=1 Tax=Phosphitispora sp. TUW77 TaxID=3152361 RepID=UPI003AB39F87